MMVELSNDVFEVALGLYMRIVAKYNCDPQVVVDTGRVGFNVCGGEVGRVERGKDGDVYGIYYAPGDRLSRSVFS